MRELQNISEVSVLSIRQIQELLFVRPHQFKLPMRTDTNLGHLNLNTVSLLVSPRDVYIII